ncbi:MAG: hypothetical protein U1E76_20295 [Planctomycetota bacterium]
MMAVTTSYLPPSRDPITTHGLGYVTLTERIVAYVDAHPERFPEISRDRNILQQLPRLTAGELTAIGRVLASEEGLR